MSIRQAKPPSDRFTRISNLWLRDPRLSWKARGLLAWLTSHATGFRVSEKTIVCAAPDGRDAARTAIAELKTYGYLVRERERGRDGRLGGVTYIICDPWSLRLAADSRAGKPPVGPDQHRHRKTPGGGLRREIQRRKTHPRKKTSKARRPEPREDQRKPASSRRRRACGPSGAGRRADACGEPGRVVPDGRRTARQAARPLPPRPGLAAFPAAERIAEALTRHSPSAVADYCAKFVGDPAFGDYEHLRRFDDVLRKLAADITDGTACPGCGHDPRHPFCIDRTPLVRRTSNSSRGSVPLSGRARSASMAPAARERMSTSDRSRCRS